MQSNQNEGKPLSWTGDELFMALNEHILVEMLDRTSKEISTESSTKEMRLGMVLGESLNISHIIWVISPSLIKLTWYFSGDRIVDVYQTSDFRQTFVWRGLCFQSEEEHQKYLQILEEKSYQPLDEILRTLEADMKKNGKMSASESIESMGFADFGRRLQVHSFSYQLNRF